MKKRMLMTSFLVAAFALQACNTAKSVVESEHSSSENSSYSSENSSFSTESTSSSSEASLSNIDNVKIIIQTDRYELAVGEYHKLNLIPVNFTGAISVISSDSSVIEVNPLNNELHALKEGSAILTASYVNDSRVSSAIQLDVISGKSGSDYNYHDFNQQVSHTHSLDPIGKQHIIVLPISIKDYESNATTENLNRIKEAFVGPNNYWESVSSFYKKSSYGKLDLEFVFPDEWYRCEYNPLEIQDHYKAEYVFADDAGSSKLVEEALKWFKANYDFTPSKFDKDQDGFVDAIWAIYSAPSMAEHKEEYEALYPGIDVNGFWAYCCDSRLNVGNYGLKADPVSKMYAWASYDFMDRCGEDKVDAHTYIHETGHLMGLKDYYCTLSMRGMEYDYPSPLGCVDMMDNNIGDHNAMSKYCYGWIKPTVINKETTIDLKPFEESGDFLLLTNEHYNNTAWDEYFTVEYITPTGLNENDYAKPYFDNGLQGYSEPGIRICHVDNRGVYADKEVGLAFSTNDTNIFNDPISNTPVTSYTMFADNVNSKTPFFQITLMQKNIETAKYNVLSESRGYYQAIRNKSSSERTQIADDALFYAGESFSLELNSPYRELMPSKSHRLDKFYDSNNESDIFDYQVDVLSISESSAKIQIKKVEISK